VETDVHATADGVPVVFHDRDLRRLTGRPDAVEALTWADLSTVRVGGAGAVPRLDDVLAAWPDIRFNIDLKAPGVVEPAVSVVRAAGASARVLLASFSDRRLAEARALAGPSIATSLGQGGVARLRLASWAGRRRRLPESVVAAQVPVRAGRLTVVDKTFLEYAHGLGLQVHAWTIDDPQEMHRLLDLGVDGIMTDRVDVLRAVYQQRSVWPGATP
jgi:glycerophosphoryl diester phosphodiesterase